MHFGVPRWLLILVSTILPALAASSTKTSCEDEWHVRSTSEDLTYAANIWNQGRVGSQCISVLPDDQQFNATWYWRDGYDAVRSYPHVKFGQHELPVRLSNVANLTVKGTWSAAVTPGRASDKARSLNDIDAKFNVAIDVFLHADPEFAQNETTADYEIMVWAGSNGSPRPLGYSKGVRMIQITNGHTFTLYKGTNHRGIKTFSWLTEDDLHTFDLDLLDLAVPLTQQDWGFPYSSYLGLVEFGTETYYAERNVTFAATDFGMNMSTTSEIPTLDIPAPTVPGAGSRLRVGILRQFDILAVIGWWYFYFGVICM